MSPFFWPAALLMTSMLPAGHVDEWPWPEPASYHSRGFGFVAEIFPPGSRQNPGNQAAAFFYRMGYPGTRWEVDAELLWRRDLVNDFEPYRMPYQALVTMDGRLVTLNEYGNVGFANAVAIYDADGELVRAFALDSLIPEADMDRFEHSESSRWWNEGARYYVTRDHPRLFVVLSWGAAMEFGLEDGSYAYGAADDFPDLSTLLAASFADEEAAVWATSLRFSSITDVQARR